MNCIVNQCVESQSRIKRISCEIFTSLSIISNHVENFMMTKHESNFSMP